MSASRTNSSETKELTARLMAGMETGPEGAPPVGTERAPLRSPYAEARWYAAYTSANHEKRVAEQLGVREVEHFLPLYSSVRRWKDRRVMLKLPLFPGYVFVRTHLQHRLQVLRIPSVIRLVSFGGEPVAIPEAELAAIRICLDHHCRIEPHPLLQKGQSVRITRGPLIGTEGTLTRRKGISRLVLSVGIIKCAIAVEVDVADIEPLSPLVNRSATPHLAAQTPPTIALADIGSGNGRKACQ